MAVTEEELFREGLGYYSDPLVAPAAMNLLNEYSDNKKWIGCDCRPDQRFMPQLWPVKNKGFRRNFIVGNTEHSSECEFNQAPYPPKMVSASHQRKARVDKILRFRLATGFREDEKATKRPKTDWVNRSTPRPGLARLLCELLTDAGVQEIEPQDHYPDYERLKGMVRNIERAAENIEIAPGKFLNEWISVGLKNFSKLKRQIANAPDDEWSGARPHGILLCNFHELEEDQLVFDGDTIDNITVDGRIAVFGERTAETRHPYLAICLIAKKDADASYPVVLRAYAHPCLNWAKWTLIDSNWERETVNRAQACRFGLSRKGISLAIGKPLFDLNRNKSDNPQPVCIPDFLIDIVSHPKAPRIVVETMGYTSDRYRNRKERLIPLFERIGFEETGKDAILVYHDPSRAVDPQDSHRDFQANLRDDILAALPKD